MLALLALVVVAVGVASGPRSRPARAGLRTTTGTSVGTTARAGLRTTTGTSVGTTAGAGLRTTTGIGAGPLMALRPAPAQPARRPGGRRRPTVIVQPHSVKVAPGDLAGFTAAASGTPAPRTQWQRSVNGGRTWTNIPGARRVTFTFTAKHSQNGTEYRAVFTNGSGRATTRAARLAVAAGSRRSGGSGGSGGSGAREVRALRRLGIVGRLRRFGRFRRIGGVRRVRSSTDAGGPRSTLR